MGVGSIVLVHQLWANGHIAMFIRAISGLKVSFAGFLYVDDGGLATVACTPTNPRLAWLTEHRGDFLLAGWSKSIWS